PGPSGPLWERDAAWAHGQEHGSPPPRAAPYHRGLAPVMCGCGATAAQTAGGNYTACPSNQWHHRGEDESSPGFLPSLHATPFWAPAQSSPSARRGLQYRHPTAPARVPETV